MKILVTGSNGLLGQKLSMLLQTQPDIQFIATAKSKNVLELQRGEFHLLDITDRDNVKAVLHQTMPDVVINTAAMTHVDKCELDKEACWKANVTSMENLVEVCSEIHAHLLHVSTDFIFDGSHGP